MATIESSGNKPSTAHASKVAAITISFWIVKTVATTVGDLSGDLLSITLGLGYVIALILVLALMTTLLVAQIRAKRFHPLLYWFLILVSSTIGAEISDTIDRALHWGDVAGAGALLAALLITLAVWALRCGRIRIYPISDRPNELFYWLAVVFANSLGSVVGDLLSERFGVTLLGGIAVNVGILAMLWALQRKTGANKAILFWTAFVFTRVSF